MPLVKYVVNIRQSTSGGDNTLMLGRTSGRGANPFLNVAGGGYRGVYDFADPDSSVFIIATGQSGHPLSRHYDDLGGLWRRGEYIPMSLDPDLARAAAVGITRLMPRVARLPRRRAAWFVRGGPPMRAALSCFGLPAPAPDYRDDRSTPRR